MELAIFGIKNGGLNLVANLFVFGLIAVYTALIVWTYLDARRRVEDPVLVTCATAGALVPFVGAFVYSILRPPELLDDVRERNLEIRAAELRVRQLSELSCPNCRYPVEKAYLRCPNCQRRLKDPCENCSKPVDPRWAVCPYCETQLPGARQRQPQRKGRSRPTQRRSEAPPRPPQRAPQQASGKRGSNAGGESSSSSERQRSSTTSEQPRPVRGN